MNYKYRVDTLLHGRWFHGVALFSSFRAAEDWAYQHLAPAGPWDAYRVRRIRKIEDNYLQQGLILPVPGRPEMAVPAGSIGAYL